MWRVLGRREMRAEFLWENLIERVYLKDLRIDKGILK
jgi:hypothetical protein